MLRALIDNAIKYVAGRHAPGRGGGRRARARPSLVSDDGPGIAPAELAHVFERFHRGRDERATTSGAGLGLSIARELTEIMGGSISAESPPDGGARFTVHAAARGLPARRADSTIV